MISVAFDYQKANTVDEAIAALSADDVKILAGGHSLLPAMKLRLSRPLKLVDISKIPSLKGIRENNGEIIIGAATTHNDISENDIIKTHLPFFSEGAAMIGDTQVRNYGTIGGSLAHADPSADWPALILAADATIDVQGSTGRRSMKATDFFTGLFSTQLLQDEIITAIRIPVPVSGTKSVYLKFRQPASRFAVVGCAVMHFPGDKTNIAFTGLSDNAFRDTAAEKAIAGKSLDDSTITAAVNAAVDGVEINSDLFASAVYRKHLAKVYLKRALQAVA
ncbi:MAG: xanthine dehydrogenase family protein subunit M [Ginsengibacter sp.]